MNTRLNKLTLAASLVAGLAFADEPKPAVPVAPLQHRPHHRTELKPFLGVVTGEAPEALRAQLGLADGEGLVVEAVAPDSPADKAGVRKLDVLHLFNDQIVSNPEQLTMLVHRAGKDTSVTLTVFRKGHEEKLTAVLGEKEMGEDFRLGAAGPLFPPHPSPYTGHTIINNSGREIQELRDQIQRQVENAMGQKGDLNKNLEELQKQIQALGAVSKDKIQESLKEIQKEVEKNLPKIPGVDIKVDVTSDVTPNAAPPALGKGLSISVVPGMSMFYTSGAKANSSSSSSSSSSSLTDGSGSYTLTTKDGKTFFKAHSADGKQLFDGPVTDEQRKAMPPALREKLAEVENRAQNTKAETAPKAKPNDRKTPAGKAPEGDAEAPR